MFFDNSQYSPTLMAEENGPDMDDFVITRHTSGRIKKILNLIYTNRNSEATGKNNCK